MEDAKLANGSEHKLLIGRSPSPAQQDQMNAARSVDIKAVRKKTASRKAKPARPFRKEIGRKSKSDKLVCRYCGSDDLAPSSSSGGIADAGSVLLSAMDQRHARGRRRSRNSSTRLGDEGPGSKGLGPFLRLALFRIWQTLCVANY